MYRKRLGNSPVTRNDLESKIWNQIMCPKCRTLLIYKDIKRLADLETFARYEVMTLRRAIGGVNNFVWCQGCNFGQLHEGGASLPIIWFQSSGNQGGEASGLAREMEVEEDERTAAGEDESGAQKEGDGGEVVFGKDPKDDETVSHLSAAD
ncbi:hypothetical protein V500_09649 [Pseudogymnoascus sp. VKM F-4518 (FW-2643)]|nr:hypothetical protein V500_09649 [Pseudogymnoascus sp. VKM F-4518 (FW-2643)]